MICDGKQENIAICFKMYTKDVCFFLPATFELKAVGSFHLILCEQVTLLIIGAELDLIKGGMFYLPLLLITRKRPTLLSSLQSGRSGRV